MGEGGSGHEVMNSGGVHDSMDHKLGGLLRPGCRSIAGRS